MREGVSTDAYIAVIFISFSRFRTLLHSVYLVLNGRLTQFSAFRPFVRPFAKVFLGAVFTYQVLYWAWLRLETNELKLEKESR
jgi:hypothetical protein